MKNTVIPNLVIAPRVMDKIAAAATEFTEDETGEAMIGLVKPGQGETPPTIYVLDTIAPDETAVRHMHTFQQGDPWQDEMIWWYQENWHARRADDIKGGPWDFPLRYLGDWHKQPGYMIAPSGGDLQTALDWLEDPSNGQEALLVPIVTLGHPMTTDDGADVNYLTRSMPNGTDLRVDWWYIHKDVRRFQPMKPELAEKDALPELVLYQPWHLRDEDRHTLEFSLLRQSGLINTPMIADIDGVLPLEYCIAAARMDGSRIFLIATHYDYPERPPLVRVAPFVRLKPGQEVADMFVEWWKTGEIVDDPSDWKWTDDTYLVDYITAIEVDQGWREPPPPEPQTDEDGTVDNEEKEESSEGGSHVG